MTTQRNLARWVNGDPGREMVRRTLDEMNQRLGRVELLANALKSMGQTNGGGLTPQQLSDVAGLIGALSQGVIGENTPDPVLTPVSSGGTVTNFSAGDLAPLFTTTETTPTTTPALAFAQINQNANLIFAGPASGVAAAPTFRILTAADLQGISAPLLSSTLLDLNTNTKQALYTIPAAKSAVITQIIARSPSVNLSGGVTTNLSFGFNAGANNWANATLGTALLTASTLFVVLSQEFALGGAASTIGTAAQVFGAITDAAFGSAATVVIEVFGYLF